MRVQILLQECHEEDPCDIEYILEQIIEMSTIPAVGDKIYLGDGVAPKWYDSKWCETATVCEVCHILFDKTHLGDVSITAIADHIHIN